MSCCDTGRCIMETPEEVEERLREQRLGAEGATICMLCFDDGMYIDVFTGEILPCPCKEPQP